jgi:hypothetical protein
MKIDILKGFLIPCLLLLSFIGRAQAIKDGKLFLNEDGSKWVKLTIG